MADPKKVSDPKFPYPEENAEQKGGVLITEPTHLDVHASSYMHHRTCSICWVLKCRVVIKTLLQCCIRAALDCLPQAAFLGDAHKLGAL